MTHLQLVTLAEEVTVVDPVAGSLSTVQIASVLLGIVLPILVGLVTKASTSPTIKAWLLAGLSAVAGFLTEFINDANFRYDQAILTAIVTFITGVAFHYGLWRPSGVTARAQAVGSGGTRKAA